MRIPTVQEIINGDFEQHITVMLLGCGYAAVHIWWNWEDSADGWGFPEPWQTGMGRYATYNDAVGEAALWAEVEGLPLKAKPPQYN